MNTMVNLQVLKFPLHLKSPLQDHPESLNPLPPSAASGTLTYIQQAPRLVP